VFGDGEYIAAGQLLIPPKMNKPSKMTKDNTYVRLLVLDLVAWLRYKFANRCSM
jgi:centromere protein C